MALVERRIGLLFAMFLLLLCNVGCTTHDLTVEKSRFRNPNRYAATSQPAGANNNLPAVAAPPEGAPLSWCESISAR